MVGERERDEGEVTSLNSCYGGQGRDCTKQSENEKFAALTTQ